MQAGRRATLTGASVFETAGCDRYVGNRIADLFRLGGLVVGGHVGEDRIRCAQMISVDENLELCLSHADHYSN